MNRDHVLTHDYLFDDFVLHANGAMSFHGQDVSIPPKELQVLITLLESKGNLVHKNFIIDKVWGDNLVGDESLTRCIYSLRRLLRESKNNRFIETVYGKGYRFCKAVTPVQRQRNQAQGCKLAILPFCDGERNEAQLLHARLMDAISSRLHAGISMVPAVLTRWQSLPDDLLVLCRQLELDCYLTGEFCQDGDQRLLTIELVDALGQSLLFRETFQPGTNEMWSQQMDAIAERILSRLPQPSSEPVRPADGEVMVSHVMARRSLRRREHGDLSMAQQYLQMGLMQDPLHVPSLVAMAETSLALAMQGAVWPVRAFSDARRSLEKALSLAPNHATALSVMAWLTRLSGDNESVAISLLHQAQGQPGASAEVCCYHALHHIARSEYDGALDMLQASLARDAGLAPAWLLKLWVLYVMGRYEEAHDFALEQLEQGQPAPLFQAVHALVMAELGCHDQAHLHAGSAIQAAPDNLPEAIMQQWVGAICQQPGEASELLSRWLGEARTRYCCPGLLACLALGLGEEIRAGSLIRLAREQRCVWWPLVKGLPRMAAFLASQSPETCWV
ncbi:winged helix-turn-helix domain-containing protein [Paludibacterium purpuratum]|uniref:DNA-binding winged helix-turn-helix (WHTH) protein n=1 Tax=Paludibacterium purpuratum TaxID=1144873 RepID=A0A4R7BE63_9NEIS|nr:winged helix-turn-helix domain-containing protein [Paludibacterium purpuratum]TDR82056.1 DNA-binding winged helix-turn-helix (wHTH) protein [Paludibacterium purpuratum]